MIAATDLQSVLTKLEQYRKPNLDETIVQLKDLRSESRIAQIVREFAPDRFKALGPVAQRRKGPNENTSLEDLLLETLGQQFPIGWGMEEMFINLEAGEQPYITTEPQGYWMSDEDFFETLTELESVSKNASAFYFAKFLDSGLGDTDDWDRAQAHFGWPKLYPNCVLTDRRVKSFDAEKFEDLLEGYGLHNLLLVFQIIWHVSGNYFFDVSEEYDYEPIEMTLDNAMWLKAEWGEAVKKRKEIDKLTQQIEENPAILALTIGYWDACIEYEKQKPKTLAEVYGALSAPQENIDPFYGPLTGEFEDDEEDEL